MKTCAEMLRSHFPNIVFSGIYESAARDIEDQDDFLNAVAQCETEKSPEDAHSILLMIEKTLQKAVPYPKGPRTIDLDILLYDDLKIETESLEVPHPRMLDRRFVLEPLCELSDNPAWKQALEKTLDQSCRRTEFSL